MLQAAFAVKPRMRGEFPQGYPLDFHRLFVVTSGLLIEAQQLDIFIPLQRGPRLQEWARLAREQGLDAGTPEARAAFAYWLAANGHAPAGLSHDGLEVLVAVMKDYEDVGAPQFEP
jgi:hypothetical protein